MNSLVILITLIFSSIVLFIVYFYKTFKYWKIKGIVYPEPIPLFGNGINLFFMKYGMGYYVFHLYKTFKESLVGFFIGDAPFLLIRDPELARYILIKDFDYFVNHTMSSNDPQNDCLLIVSKSSAWKQSRKYFNPLFSTLKLKAMFENMKIKSAYLEEYLRQLIDRSNELDLKNLFAKYLTDSIIFVLFGVEAYCMKNDKAEFNHVSKSMFNYKNWIISLHVIYIFIARRMARIFRFKFIDSETNNFLKEFVWNSILARNKNNVVRNDVIDFLIEDEKLNNINEYHSTECDILCAKGAQFYIAALETSSIVLTAFFFEISKNNDIQTKLREELLEIKANNKGKSYSYEDIRDAKYLDMCVKEALRKYPSLPYLDRMCEKTYKVPGYDLIIDKGTSVYFSTLGLHMDPKYYPDPEKFNPERFSPENIKNLTPYTFLPFGGGPRACIGERYAYLSIKLAIATILPEYEVSTCTKTPEKLEFFKQGFLLMTSHPVYIKLKKLKD